MIKLFRDGRMEPYEHGHSAELLTRWMSKQRLEPVKAISSREELDKAIKEADEDGVATVIGVYAAFCPTC